MLLGACFSLLVGGAGCSVTTTPDSSGPTCGPDSTVACPGATGYSCTGGDSPDQSDPGLICSQGKNGNAGSTIYCCAAAFSGTNSCGEDSTVSGCEPPSIGFSCTGSDAPDDPEGDPTLNCSAGVPGNNNSTLYCCE